MMDSFAYIAHPARVWFGDGRVRHVTDEVDALGASRALVLCSAGHRGEAQEVAAMLGSRCVGIFAQAAMHVPIELARRAREHARELGADCAVAVGGGSTIGLGKAIALESALPIVAVPTTYAGSEMTPIYGLTEGGVKRTGRDPRVLPRSVIYDPRFSATLPLSLSVCSGLNAIAHAAEGLYAANTNPIMQLLAEEGIEALGRALPALCDDPSDPRARRDALYGSWLCGSVLAHVDMALHHKLCHTLGGSFDLPHAGTHAVVLPHALAYNAAAVPDAMRRIAGALGVDDAPAGVYELARRCGAPVSLREIGMPADALDRACELALQGQYPNPRQLQQQEIRALLQRAYDGSPPQH